MREYRAFALLAALAALAGCGGDEGRGGITEEEDRQLNEAAAMVEENVFDASPDSLVANVQALDEAGPPEGGDANNATDGNGR